MSVKITVIMGIYNCAGTLSEALDSLLAQTYSDWNAVLCDDGSSDDTYRIASGYAEKFPDRFILIKNEHNMGLNHTLNRCLELARGEYIARMDGDDISLPARFEAEAGFLDAHPQYSVVSTPMIYFNENGEWGRGTAGGEVTARDFVHGSPFCHAPCMVRSGAYAAVGGYSTDRRTLRAEDYDLWFRMYELGYKGYNLDVPLYKMRDDENAYHRRKLKYCFNEAFVRAKGFERLKLPIYDYVFVLRPLIVGLLPKRLYMFLHHRKNR